MINRLSSIVGLLLTMVSLSSYAQSWHFDVYLDKSNIGTHTFDLNDGKLVSKANFNVKILFINAYRYQHQAIEHWQNQCLTSLQANTNDNGETIKVIGKQQAKQFDITANQLAQTLPQCIMTFAYWNPEILKQKQLLNPQNAEYLDTDIQLINEEAITVRKQSVLTKHYRIKASLNGVNKLNIDVWYNQDWDLVALTSTTKDGNKLIYKIK